MDTPLLEQGNRTKPKDSNVKEQGLGSVCTNISSSEICENSKSKQKQKGASRKKKKEKIKQKRLFAKQRLQSIIRNIYNKKTNFDSSYQQIQNIFDADLDQDHFYEFINETIRQQIQIISEEIKIVINNMCEACNQGNAEQVQDIKIDRNEIIRLGEMLENIKHASTQVEKIINVFENKILGDFSQQDNYSENYQQHHLYIETMKYILESTPEKQDFEQICISYLKFIKQQPVKRILVNILTVIHIIAEQDQQYNSNQNECSNEDETKQEQSQGYYNKMEKGKNHEVREDQLNEQQQQGSKKKKKKKKKKNKKNKKKQAIGNKQEQQDIQQIIKYLEQYRIVDKESRSTCYTTQQWSFNIRHRYKII